MNERSLQQSLKDLITILSELDFFYHLTGGLITSYYGEPRMTQDIDVVIKLRPQDADKILESLSPVFIVDDVAAKRLIEEGGLFQALHEESMFKVDFHVGELVPGELKRSKLVELIPGVKCKIASKEDTIISKLIWAKRGSGKSKEDLKGLLLDTSTFDEVLLQDLSKELFLEKELQEAQTLLKE